MISCLGVEAAIKASKVYFKEKLVNDPLLDSPKILTYAVHEQMLVAGQMPLLFLEGYGWLQ